MRQWSKYQQDIFKDVAEGEGHTVVQALAGSSKTTSILESLNHIPPGNSWILVAFNKEIAKNLKSKAPPGGEIRTLHSLGLKAITKTKGFKNISINEYKLDTILDDLVKSDRKWRAVKYQLIKTINLAKGCLVSTEEEIENIIEEYQIEFDPIDPEKFVQTVLTNMEKSKNITSVIDYDDMIWFPHVHSSIKIPQYDRIFVDEAQDLNKAQIQMILKMAKQPPKKKIKSFVPSRIMAVGDKYQCVDEHTKVKLIHQDKYVKDLVVGDKILSYKNSELIYSQVTQVVKSDWRFGIKITTKSGKTLTMSPNHKIWADGFETLETKHIVYLMYRPDLGYRVGKTNKWKDSVNRFENGTLSERADRLWILDVVSSNKKALLLEETYSLEYGIPTVVFDSIASDLDQNRINKIYKRSDQNGLKILEDKNLLFDFPHWMTSTVTAKTSSRPRVLVSGHTKKGTQVSLEWSDPDITVTLKILNINFTKAKKGFRIRKYFKNYVQAVDFAQMISNELNCSICEKFSFENNPMLLTASGLFPGMKVIQLNNDNNVIYDEIITTEIVSGNFIDLEVDDTANFFGNEILSHNSIYRFRGADKDAIDNITESLQAKTLPLSITYRCPLKVVEEAQKLVPELEAAPNAIEGKVEYISNKEMQQLARPGCFILSRTNAPMIGIALNFLKRKIPCNIQGRDIGLNLINFIKTSKASSIEDFMVYLDKWSQKEINRLQAQDKNIDHILDRVACFESLVENCFELSELEGTIDQLFDDVDDQNQIILSTVHRAKGLERDTVFILNYTFVLGFSQEEINIKYVAITRCKNQLFFVYADNQEK